MSPRVEKIGVAASRHGADVAVGGIVASELLGKEIISKSQAELAASQVLTAIEASGRWRIVPVEPTDKIVGVLKSPIYGPLNPQTVAVSLEEGRQRWRDALSASPKATHTAEEGK